jgi:hypothetical protein
MLGASRLAYLAKAAAAGPVGFRPVTITPHGDVQHTTSDFYFGSSSIIFDGTGDYLSTSQVSDGISGDFTLEFAFKADTTSNDGVVIHNYTSWAAGAFTMYFSSTGNLKLSINSMTDINTSVSTNTWTHIAVVRSGTSVTVYKDGNSVSSQTYTGTLFENQQNLYMGTFGDGLGDNYDGFLDEVRLSDTARYTSNFTIPGSQFATDANTLFLMHSDTTNGSTTFVDDTTAPTETLTSLTSVNWNRAQYYSYNMEYVGDDSSGNPVVAFAYVDDTNNQNAYAILVSINKSTYAVTEGSINNFYTGAGGGDPLEAPILCAEQGSNACAICYMDRNATGGYEVFGIAATLDLDALTFSFGTAVTVESSSLDAFALNAHVGNGNYAMGNRSGGGRYHLMTRSGNSLSKTSTSTVGMSGGNVYNETEGFDASGSLYRFTRLNSTGGVDISAGYFNGSNASLAASATPITGLSSVIISHHARLNTSNKGIAISSDNTTTKAAAYEVTWPSSGTGAPSISTGSQLTLSNDAYGDAYHVAESTTTDQAYYVYSDSGGNWNSRPITASGTSLSEGSATSLSLLTSSQFTALDFIAFADSNGNELLVGVIDNTGSNAPDIYVKNLDA